METSIFTEAVQYILISAVRAGDVGVGVIPILPGERKAASVKRLPAMIAVIHRPSIRREGAGPLADLQGGVLLQRESDGIAGLELKGLEHRAIVADNLHLGVEDIAHHAAERAHQIAERTAVQTAQRRIHIPEVVAGGFHTFEGIAAGLDILADNVLSFPQRELLRLTETAPDYLLPRLLVSAQLS